MAVQKKPPRKNIPVDRETAVLINSGRRCVLCFHLNGDLEEKHGQIAHLDGIEPTGQKTTWHGCACPITVCSTRKPVNTRTTASRRSRPRDATCMPPFRRGVTKSPLPPAYLRDAMGIRTSSRS